MNDNVDVWAWWRAACLNPKEIGRSIIATSEPHWGYFRRKLGKGKPWIAVAIWQNADGTWTALRFIDGATFPVDGEAEWLNCYAHPVVQDEFERVAEQGLEWSDSEPTVVASMAAPKPGHNSDERSEADMLRDDIQALLDGIKAYAKITTEDAYDKAQSLRARLLEMKKKADDTRDKLKRPHLEAGNAIQREWKPIVDMAQGGADTLRKALSAFATAKRDIEIAKAAAEQAALRKAQEAVRLPLAESPGPEADAPVAPLPAPVAGPKGNYGRGASARVEWSVTGIADQDALYRFMREQPELKEVLLKLAKRETKLGHDVPGITKQEVVNVQ